MNAETTTRTWTYTAKVSKPAHRKLENFLIQLTILWNAALQERSEAYSKQGVKITAYDQQKSLTKIRADDEWFSGFHLHSQRSALQRLDRAFQNFFRRVKAGEKPGYPRFKSVRRGVKSFETGSFSVVEEGAWKSVTFKGVGKFRFQGEVVGEPKVVRIVKTPRRVKLMLVCEIPLDPPKDTRPPLGIDVGVRERFTLSNGVVLPKVSIDRRRLKRLQRLVDRAVEGSNNRRKKIAMLAKEWQRVSERQKAELHRITDTLVKEHSARFAVEDLPDTEHGRRGRQPQEGIEPLHTGADMGHVRLHAGVQVPGGRRRGQAGRPQEHYADVLVLPEASRREGRAPRQGLPVRALRACRGPRPERRKEHFPQGMAGA